MDKELQAIRDAFIHYPPEGEDRSFIDLYLVPNITPANAREVLGILAAHADLNRAFWAMINRLPSTDEGWRALSFIGSGMSNEDLQERNRQRLRRAVEIVRNEVGSIQTRRNELFRPHR
ncbi:hypothetical protein [Roseateles sp. L2-2]|uniref:hypothetical protein n=1 Tax=Roseateles TaxID=93681 RepID=UPI003D3600F6